MAAAPRTAAGVVDLLGSTIEMERWEPVFTARRRFH
jgi:hypothetical protein